MKMLMIILEWQCLMLIMMIIWLQLQHSISSGKVVTYERFGHHTRGSQLGTQQHHIEGNPKKSQK